MLCIKQNRQSNVPLLQQQETNELISQYKQFYSKAKINKTQNSLQKEATKPALVEIAYRSAANNSDSQLCLLNSIHYFKTDKQMILDFFCRNIGESVADLNDECAICQQAIYMGENVVNHPICKHSYHWDCLKGWLKIQMCCPMCRKQTRSAGIVSVWRDYFEDNNNNI